MSDKSEVRAAISALLPTGKVVKEIIADVGCSHSLACKVKNQLQVGKSAPASPRKRAKMPLTL